MNSTERLLGCLRGEQIDRVPISTYELVGWDQRDWANSEPSYRRLMDFIREHTDCMFATGVGVPNARAGEWNVSVERWDQGDQHIERRTIEAPGRTLTTTTSHSDDIHTVWRREHPVKDLDDLAAWLDLPWAPGEPDFSHLAYARGQLAGGRGLPVVSLSDPICDLAEAFEFSEFTIHAITETDAMVAALDRLHQRHLAELDKILAGPVQDVIFRICGPEYATPPYLGPEFFERFVTRYDSEYVRMIQQAGGFARIHCHGRTGRVIEHIEAMGPDAMDPLEPPPDGDISVADLKARLGDRVCLMGGIELKHLEGSGEAFVEQLTRETIRAGKPGGRFVIMPTAAPINVPLSPQTEANYIRFIETALAEGRY
jgi:hypothetical protein